MSKPKWRIYYADKDNNIFTFSSLEGTPEEAPDYGVLCIIQTEEDYNRNIMHGWDVYYWVPQDQQWFGSWELDYERRVEHGYQAEHPKYGIQVSNAVMREALSTADMDPDFPKQTGPAPGEHPPGIGLPRTFGHTKP